MISFKKKFFIFAAVLAITMCTISAAYAVSNMQTVQAFLGVKIIYDGQELTDSNQPYLINNTTYVPLRMLMNYFGDKEIQWDSTNKCVVIKSKTSANEAILNEQLTQKDAQILSLQNNIATLNAKISELENENNSVSVSDIEDTLNDYFEDAGYEYFSDEGIMVKTISLTGDEDDLVYTIKLDFSDADNYSYLTEVSETKIKSFLNAVKSKIVSETDGTDYEDASITGKLIDNDNTGYYAKYDDGSYTFSWDEDSTSVSDIEDTLNDYFEDAGYDYFDDEGIVIKTISLAGDEDDLVYTIKLDFSDSYDYADLTEVSKTKIKSFLNAVKSRIGSETDDTDYEDADITGKLIDNDHAGYYVKYEDGTYTFSWE